MTTSFWQKADAGPSISCDIAIVGGGIIGTSTAYWLKKIDPSLDVVLLESRSVGFGASGRNAGFLLQGTASNYALDRRRYGNEKATALWQFTKDNRNLVIDEFEPGSIQLKKSGSLIVAGSPQEQHHLEASANYLQQEGEDVQLWNTSDLKKKLKSEGFAGALYVASGASMNPLKLVRHIAGLSGARVLEHHSVFNLEHINGNILLHTPLRKIQAPQVFLALNAYLPRLLPQTSQLIRPIRAQMLASSPQSPWLDYPVYSHEGYYYIRQAPDGSILLGGARHLHEREEVGYEDTTTHQLQRALELYYGTHFPGRPALSVTKRWSGTMAFTNDGLPLFAELEGSPGSFWAAGFNGHGMGYGFRFGKLMAHVLTDSAPDSYYRNLFHKSRLSGIIQ